jgi:HD-like signal output (HDOD) protein
MSTTTSWAWWTNDTPALGRAATLVRRVTELCPLPASTQKVLEVASREDVDLREIARVVECDPALAARVLRLANSSSMGGRDPVTDLRKAVIAIGLGELRTLAAAMALLAAFRNAEEAEIDLHAVGTMAANVAGSLAARMAPGMQATAFSCGLLCEVGALATLAVDATEYLKIWRSAHDGRAPWGLEACEIRAALEMERYGATTATLGAMLFVRNSLPASMVRAVEARDALSPSEPLLNRIVAFSRLASNALMADLDEEQLIEAVIDIARRAWLHEIGIDEIVEVCKDAGQVAATSMCRVRASQ